MTANFKNCPSCQKAWATQEDYISDTDLELNGYQADLVKLEYGMFFFTHMAGDCYSTMAVEVNEFLNLYEGPYYSERRTGKEDCPGYCKDKKQLDRCEALCECAFVREICSIIRQRQSKHEAQSCSN